MPRRAPTTGDAVVKRLILLPVLIGAPAQIWGQSAATTSQPNDPVMFAELVGSVIEARVVRDQIIRREGRTFPVRSQDDIKLVIGADNKIQQSVTVTADTPGGQRKGPTRTGVYTLGEQRPIGSLGGGNGLLTFEDGVLTFIRSFKEGAAKRTFAFSRGPDGLSCTANQTFGREGGVGDLVMNSAIDDNPVIVVSSKQISSTCQVKQSKTPTAGDAAVGETPDNK
jgi:hypothetical protein